MLFNIICLVGYLNAVEKQEIFICLLSFSFIRIIPEEVNGYRKIKVKMRHFNERNVCLSRVSMLEIEIID